MNIKPDAAVHMAEPIQEEDVASNTSEGFEIAPIQTLKDIETAEISNDSDSQTMTDIRPLKFIQNEHIRQFVDYLIEAPILKGIKTSHQHGQQVFEMWQFITPNMTVHGLFNIERLRQWCTAKVDALQPGSIRSYLSSMVLFVEYLIACGKTEEVESAMRLKESCKVTSKNFRKKVMQRRTVVETEEMGAFFLKILHLFHNHKEQKKR